MNVKGKYLKDENDNIISPIVSASTIYDSGGTNLQDILNRVPHICDSMYLYSDWDSVVTSSTFQCVKFTNVYDEKFDTKGAPTNAYRWGLLISIITTIDHTSSLNYTNVQIYMPDTGTSSIYYRTFNAFNVNIWNIIQGGSYTPSYGYDSHG